MNAMEKFVLSAINDKKSRLFAARTYLRYGLGGIALIELAKLGRISIDNKKLVVQESSSTGDPILDEVLAVSAKKKSPVRLDSLIYSLSYKVKNLEKRIIEKLEDNGVLRIDEERFLGIIPYQRYVVTNVTSRSRIINSMRDVLLQDNRTPDIDSVALVSMANSCDFFSKLFSREERKLVKERLKLISKGKYFETKDQELLQIFTAVRRTIQAVQTAVATAGSAGG